MHKYWNPPLLAGGIAIVTAAFAGPALAQVATVPSESAFVFNTFSLLIWGCLVMWMAAGFTMLETGFVRSKNAGAICLKNMALYSVAGFMYLLFGYDLMFPNAEGDFFGALSLTEINVFVTAESALLSGNGNPDILAQVTEAGHSRMSDWFFQMVFVATAASIISGTLAERIRVWPFIFFVTGLTAVIYPLEGAWIWNDGWLAEMGFKDFAGATVVHSLGGWCALTGAIILGPRKGKFGPDGKINPMPGANMPLATLGTFILWFGWFGFNAGSLQALGSAADAMMTSIIIVNTNLAAASGVLGAMIVSQMLFGKLDLTYILNGALGGLVAITAGPDLTNFYLAIVIGTIGGVLTVIAIPLIERMRVDDVVGAISAHLVAGVWGTLAVGIFGSGDLRVQMIGVGAIAAYAIVTSSVLWLVLRFTIGIRVSEEAEDVGLDAAALQVEAYPEFGDKAR